jgi:hypothetical protein
MKKGIKISILFLAVILMYGCVSFLKLSDLQSDGYSYPNNPDKGKLLLGEMGIAHQIHMWDSIETYKVIYEDEFYGFLGKQAHPFKEQKIRISLNYIPKTFDGQLEIISGKEKGSIWGIQSWETYRKGLDGKITIEENKDMKFWIPTYQYFIEFPNRIQEASSVDYIGEKTINGIECEGVIASWNTVSPQKDIDQYVIWLDSKNKMIVKVEYTVREAYKFITGAVYFQDYRDYDGIILPSALPVESNLKKEGFLHTMSIKDFTANQMSSDTLTPLD